MWESDAKVAHAPEGSRFSTLGKTISRVMGRDFLLPVVLKLALRSGPKTVQAALDAGIKTVDISGRGGILVLPYIENRRGGNRLIWGYRIRWIRLRS